VSGEGESQLYSILGNEYLVDLVRESFARTLEERGYQLDVESSEPGSPHRYRFDRGGRNVSISVDDTAGQRWETRLAVSATAEAAEAGAILRASLGRLLAHISGLLLESVDDPGHRSAVACELSRVLSTLD